MIISRFIGIWDFNCAIAIRGWKYALDGVPKITIRITGLHEILVRDYGNKNRIGDPQSNLCDIPEEVLQYMCCRVQFYSWLKVYFPLLWGMVIYDNSNRLLMIMSFKQRTEPRIKHADEIEPQNMGLHLLIGYHVCPCWNCVPVVILRLGT